MASKLDNVTLNKTRKADLLMFRDDLGLFVSHDTRTVYLIKMMTESGDYEEGCIKIRLEVFTDQREERKQQVEEERRIEVEREERRLEEKNFCQRWNMN